jgi:hypothetical protein
MKFVSGRMLSAAIAAVIAAILIYNAPFEAAAATPTASSQVVYAPLFSPPVISGAPAKLDLPLLLLELGFVVFLGSALFFAAGQHKNKR